MVCQQPVFNVYLVKPLLFVYFYFMYIAVVIRSSGTGITDRCQLPCEFWDLNPGPLEKQSVLLTAEPSLVSQPHEEAFNTWVS